MRPGIITFDCYGTLIDWNLGISQAFGREAERQGLAVEDEEILRAYHEVEPEVQAQRYRSYRQVLTLLESAVARRLGWEAPERRGYLADSLPSWPPFPDTNPALRRLQEVGYRLGILSNIDDDLLARTLQHFEVEFDLLVTAERVQSYKPASAHFERALEKTGFEPGQLLHIAQSYFHDIRPATALGIPAVWVNRGAEIRPEDGPAPAAKVGDLKEAVAWVEQKF